MSPLFRKQLLSKITWASIAGNPGARVPGGRQQACRRTRGARDGDRSANGSGSRRAGSTFAASCAGMLAAAVGPRAAYCAGVATFGLGALLCSLAPTMGWIVVGRLVQGFGGGLEAAAAYVAVRAT